MFFTQYDTLLHSVVLHSIIDTECVYQFLNMKLQKTIILPTQLCALYFTHLNSVPQKMCKH